MNTTKKMGLEVPTLTDSYIRSEAELLRDNLAIPANQRFVRMGLVYDSLRSSEFNDFDYEVSPDKLFKDGLEAYYVNGVVHVRQGVFESALSFEVDPYRFNERETAFARRSRFTLAHELGHHLLHWHQEVQANRRRYARTRGRCAEEQANTFAAHFLISSKVCQQLYRDGWFDVDSLMKYFGVSRNCAKTTINHFEPI